MDFFENCLKNLKKFGVINVAELTDYDGFSAEIHRKNSVPGLIRTKNHKSLERSIFSGKPQISRLDYWKMTGYFIKSEGVIFSWR